MRVSARITGYTVNFYPDIQMYPGSRATFRFEIGEQLLSRYKGTVHVVVQQNPEPR
jgi:hypothetical protein